MCALFQVNFEFERFLIDLDNLYFLSSDDELTKSFFHFLAVEVVFKYFKAVFDVVRISLTINLIPMRAIIRISFS